MRHRGAVEEGLGIGWTELEIGDDVGPTDLHQEARLKCVEVRMD